jgi:hypothetical protein
MRDKRRKATTPPGSDPPAAEQNELPERWSALLRQGIPFASGESTVDILPMVLAEDLEEPTHVVRADSLLGLEPRLAPRTAGGLQGRAAFVLPRVIRTGTTTNSADWITA